MVLPKIKIYPPFTFLEVIPNLFEFIASVENKKDILKNVGHL